MNTADTTRRQKAFARFKALHPNYHGGFLADCFIDAAMDILDQSSYHGILGLDPNDECWDKVYPEINTDKN